MLLSWLSQVLPDHSRPEPASSDASFRRYFRVFSDRLPNRQGHGSAIVMDAPPQQEDCRPFIAVSEQLHAAGVRVPQVLAQNLEQGFLLLDDMGHTTLLTALQTQDEKPAYARALDSLLQIQQCDASALPAYGAALLAREIALFHDWYLGVHCQRLLTAGEQAAWDVLCQQLIEQVLSQPQGYVHRDYHSRNLMWSDTGPLGVIDFQDAVHGPLTYDLVSLLRDCYVAWPDAQVQAWLSDYQKMAQKAGLAMAEQPQLQKDFDWMGVQRHLKAVGIFARLNHRDGKAVYLGDIPRALEYIVQVSARYPQLKLLEELARECLE